MKEVTMDLGKENRGSTGQNDLFQLTTSKNIMTAMQALCVVCALRRLTSCTVDTLLI
jgi:hypothetical protein